MSKPLSRHILALPLLAALFAAPTAMAERARLGQEYVFTTVDDYSVNFDGYVNVTGILEGEATPRTIAFWSTSTVQGDLREMGSRCDRMALLVMTKPGAYLFTMSEATLYSLRGFLCKLTRVP